MAYGVVSLVDAVAEVNVHLEFQDITGGDGNYRTDCIDLSQQALGMMLVTDDAVFDGVQGSWYPTFTPVVTIEGEDDLTCVPQAPDAWALPADLVQALSAVPGLENTESHGLSFIIITDGNRVPVSGARLYKDDQPHQEWAEVFYPNAEFSDFSATNTSSNGIAIVTGPLGLTRVIAEKPGMLWQVEIIGVVQGRCFVWTTTAIE